MNRLIEKEERRIGCLKEEDKKTIVLELVHQTLTSLNISTIKTSPTMILFIEYSITGNFNA